MTLTSVHDEEHALHRIIVPIVQLDMVEMIVNIPFGVLANSPMVCSGHGTCGLAPNNCTCFGLQYWGIQCEFKRKVEIGPIYSIGMLRAHTLVFGTPGEFQCWVM
jgi:uncharacterized FlgJ-related protein